MSARYALPSGPSGQPQSSVLHGRIDRAALIGLAGVVPFLIALGISVENPQPNFVLDFGVLAGVLGVVALAAYSRLEVTVTILALYLGMVNGPVKLLVADQGVSSLRDVLIAAVSVGAIIRLLAKREPIKLPPLWGWVAAFVVLVLIEAVNPNTQGFLKIVGGYRQNLEWIPFFFFGYALIRSKDRLRKMFIVLGVIALANGVVSTYQTQLSPAQLASWGPGYAEVVNGNVNEEGVNEEIAHLGGKTYKSEGVSRVRPMGLGNDSGFGSAVGVIALPCALALLATGGRRRRWYAILFCLGAMVAVATGLGRLQVVGAVVAAASFALLSLSAGERVIRPLVTLLAIAAIALPLGALFVSSVGAGVFSRYESIEPSRVTETSESYKSGALPLSPEDLEHDPFGFGLGTVGPATAFGGKVHDEEVGKTAETQYNYVVDELGGPGLILWIALAIEVIVLVVRRLPRIEDIDIRICLAAVFAVFLAHIVMGFRGAFMDAIPAASFFWFSLGIAAYWLAGPGRQQHGRRAREPAALHKSAA